VAVETVLRVAFVYVLVWACFRILGKRELTQMSPFELVTLLFIPQLFSRALTRQDYSMTNAVIGATTLFTLVFLTSAVSYRSDRFRRVIQARPTVLVHRGILIEEHLNRERIGPDDIFSAMHKVGLDRLEQVEWAILEADGRIALIPIHAPSQNSEPEERHLRAGAGSGVAPTGNR
jgi:uncharacterized membrane protein YcaP (DUF421 family)